MAVNKAELKKQLHAMGVKTYRNKVTGASFVKRKDVKKIIKIEAGEVINFPKRMPDKGILVVWHDDSGDRFILDEDGETMYYDNGKGNPKIFDDIESSRKHIEKMDNEDKDNFMYVDLSEDDEYMTAYDF